MLHASFTVYTLWSQAQKASKCIYLCCLRIKSGFVLVLCPHKFGKTHVCVCMSEGERKRGGERSVFLHWSQIFSRVEVDGHQFLTAHTHSFSYLCEDSDSHITTKCLNLIPTQTLKPNPLKVCHKVSEHVITPQAYN